MKVSIKLMVLSAVIVLSIMSVCVDAQNYFSGPRRLGATINSSSAEGQPLFAPNGLALYFASDRLGQGNTDIYVSRRATLMSQWGPAQNLGPSINTSAADFPTSFSLDGRQLFISSLRTDGSMGSRDIWLLTRTDPNDDFGWNAPVNLGAPVNTICSDFAATYFEDATTGTNSLIFARECNPNKPPFHDLYQSTRNTDGTFNTPTPIDELNSIGTETRTAIRRDGLEIFIASSRPGIIGPMGTFDIFVATRTSTTSPWSTPAQVPGINTVANDQSLALSPDGSILFFSSNRPGTSGASDLYSATRCSLYGDAPCAVNRTVADFDADGVTDLSVFRPSDGNWWVFNSASGTVSAQQFGTVGDKPVAGDYDGDNRLDLAIFRPSTDDWWILPSLTNSAYADHWGESTDTPVPGDYDGDGKTDVAVFRDGAWYIHQSSNGQLNYQQFGTTGDVPVPGAQ